MYAHKSTAHMHLTSRLLYYCSQARKPSVSAFRSYEFDYVQSTIEAGWRLWRRQHRWLQQALAAVHARLAAVAAFVQCNRVGVAIVCLGPERTIDLTICNCESEEVEATLKELRSWSSSCIV